MRLINKKSLILLTSILLVIISVLVIKQTKPVELDEVKLLEASNNTSFAMYVGTDNIYEEYKGNLFPNGYNLNLDKSKCIDSNGNEIKDSLEESDNKIVLTTNKTAYCYLYFDEKVNLSNVCKDNNMQECISNKKDEITTIENMTPELISNLYRYHGLNVDNYICFGTSDKQTCFDNQDKFMYRIIGIEESGKIKIIKTTSMGDIQWNENASADFCGDDGENCNWDKSTIRKYLNEDFLNNKEYIPTGWEDKIEDTNWLTGTAPDFGTSSYGQYLYKLESGSQSVEKNKIGLLYMSDHYYAYGDGLGETDCDNFYCNSWIYYVREWTMSFIGFDKWHNLIAAMVTYGASVGAQPLNELFAVRPTFYLKPTTKLSGLGTIDNPYIIMN